MQNYQPPTDHYFCWIIFAALLIYILVLSTKIGSLNNPSPEVEDPSKNKKDRLKRSLDKDKANLPRNVVKAKEKEENNPATPGRETPLVVNWKTDDNGKVKYNKK